jgi:hypothetical protein
MITNIWSERTASNIPSKGLQLGSKKKQREKGVQDYNKDKSSESYDTTSTSPGNLAYREQMSGKNTMIYKLTGDKIGNRQNVFAS